MEALKLIFILSCLFAFINSTCLTDEESSNIYKSYKDCVNRTFSSEEIEEKAYKCCYVHVEYKIEGTKLKYSGCAPLTQSEYNNIDQTKRTIKAEIEGEDIDIDIKCESSFIKLGILFLLYFLLFI
jgi:hypothetical protein